MLFANFEGQRSRSLPAMSAERLPVLAVVGRPNVGKSTLINRIIGRRDGGCPIPAGGHPRPSHFHHANWADRQFSGGGHRRLGT